jgi:N-6 DNA Methylase
MTILRRLREEIVRIGYLTIESQYLFPDVFSTSSPNRNVPLAAFTHSPPSYRNAALAVVEAQSDDPVILPDEYRALGAPLLFAIEGERITVRQIRSSGRPTILTQVGQEGIGALFSENQQVWNPRKIHNAKSFGLLNKSFQLDFVDVGLMPAIEGEVHDKLDRLLNEALAETVRLRIVRRGEQKDDRVVFRTVFRLLAAKVLQDRGHELAGSWDATNIDSVLKGISGYYTLPALPGESGSFKNTVFESAWRHLRKGISFRNISSDDLAFVYENTLVTETTRQHFGTHSTPRAVAEYIVNRLELSRGDISKTKIYEPFAGAGVFMVAALRQLRDILNIDVPEVERHRFLVDRMVGDEIDTFATEVASLSLILADYPNDNGWVVSQVDLFKQYALRERAQGATIILCNPPFEAFRQDERLQYPEAAARSPYKPIAVLEGVLDAQPAGIGFVLPEPFIEGKQYKQQRLRIESLYKEIEIVSLPDRVFKASAIRSSLLIAREPRLSGDATTSIRSTVVSVRGRERFLRTGEVIETRERVRPFGASPGDLWVIELEEIWEYLSNLAVLEGLAEVHKGVEWEGAQSNAVSNKRRDGFHPGIHAARAVHTFALDNHVFLDARPRSFAKRAAAHKRPWDQPKLLANAARISRGPWCFAAAVDCDGLMASQQLFGIWAKDSVSLNALCALLNAPFAVAYIACHSPPDRIRVSAVNAVPIPRDIPSEINELVKLYVRVIAQGEGLFSQRTTEKADRLLNEIDALVLKAYDLPPRLERRLLEYFRGSERPTVHAWEHWFPEGFRPFVPLHEYLSDDYRKARKENLLGVFVPLPIGEASALREALD